MNTPAPRGRERPGPVLAAVGTAAVVRRPGGTRGRHRDPVLGGSGLLMAAAGAALGLPTRLACHVGSDPDGTRIRDWASAADVQLFAGRSARATVGLVEALVDGEGMITAGTADPGPAAPALWAAAQDADILLVGDTSDRSLRLVLRGSDQPGRRLLVTNLSAAWTRSWPLSRTLWKASNLVTLGDAELHRLGLTCSAARNLL